MIESRFYTKLGPVSLVELCDGLDVEWPEGQFGDIQIHNAAPVNLAGVSDITFFEGRKAKALKLECKAEVCLATEDNAEAIAQHKSLVVVSKSPRADFAKILDRLYQPVGYEEQETSFDGVKLGSGVVVAQDAKIGSGSVIGPNAVIGPGVVIGENCKIGANTVIEFSTLGNNCVVQPGAVVGGSGFGVAMSSQGCVDIPHVGSVQIGNNVSIGCQTTIDRAMFGETKISDGSKFDNLVQVAHNVRIGENCIFAGHVGLSGSCVIGNNVTMGGGVGLADHIEVGDGATLAADAGVMHNIPAGEVWGGTPAMPLRQQMRQFAAIRRLTEKKDK